mmetsp:Transcript_22307/g.52542  ORF Transcript_22307/g.52542 Transcript_22307/m.52542 type:complete len:95 (+) Transcript_22307:1009-1293(+)
MAIPKATRIKHGVQGLVTHHLSGLSRATYFNPILATLKGRAFVPSCCKLLYIIDFFTSITPNNIYQKLQPAIRHPPPNYSQTNPLTTYRTSLFP